MNGNNVVERFGYSATAIADFISPATFSTGDTEPNLVDCLKQLGTPRTNLSRGTYRCSYCDNPNSVGDSKEWGASGFGPFEIHVWAPSGQLFVAPNLIVHYIETHGYKPPQEFIEAAYMAVNNEALQNLSVMAERLFSLSENSNIEALDLLVSSLNNVYLYFPTESSHDRQPDETHLKVVEGPDKQNYLSAFIHPKFDELTDGYAKIHSEELPSMLTKMPNIEGIILQGSSWAVIKTNRLVQHFNGEIES